MSATLIHTEFQKAFDLDHASLSFLSAMYYQQKQNDKRPVSPTQNHIENMTGVGIYAQRRIRKTLSVKGLLIETKTMEVIEEQGYRTKIYYDINCSRLDSLLATVEIKKAEKNKTEELSKINKTQASEVKRSTIPVVKMHQEWLPNDDALSSYLKAYEIDGRFAVYDVLPEFVEYWMNADCEFRPIEWQAKFHASVRHQWEGDMNRKRNQAKVLRASDLKANAIASLKEQQAKQLLSQAAQYRTPRTTIEKLTDRSWAEGLQLDNRGECFV